MALLNGIHHLATLTADLDRLIAFYEQVFDAHLLLDLDEDGLRHAFIELGPTTVLHPFQITGREVPQGAIPVFARGRLDHVALNVSSEEAFRQVRRRVIAAGAGDGVVTDMGSLLYLGFTDPDGGEHEIIWAKPGVPLERGLRRAEWTTVEMD